MEGLNVNLKVITIMVYITKGASVEKNIINFLN